MDNPVIEYYEGINKVSITMLQEWFRNFVYRNKSGLLVKPKILVSSIVQEIKHSIQVSINDDLKTYLIYCKNDVCIDKYYFTEDYSNAYDVFIKLLIMLKKAVKVS